MLRTVVDMETRIDVLVIGGGAAGAAAALQFGRARRPVAVIDDGEPRNAPVAHMHGYLGRDGCSPAEFARIARTELAVYGVEVTPGRVSSIVDAGDHLVCRTATGDTYRARRILLASGLTDVLPAIDGVRENWGTRVIHCPWCHGWEVRDQAIAVIDTSGIGVHQALLFAHLSDDVRLIRNHPADLTDDELQLLRLGGVSVETRHATAVHERDDRLEIVLAGAPGARDTLVVDAAVVAPRFEPNVAMLDGMVEIADHPSGMGRHVVVDAMGTTSHPLIFAAGNVSDPMQQVLHAAADGSKVATMIHAGLIDDDLEHAGRSEIARIAWDERYAGHDQMWSGRPNGPLVAEVGDLVPGRALDVGCGEGGDAIWLARQGWQVSATDISTIAIARARDVATDVGVDVDFAAVDVIADPPPEQAFDLVVVSYPALKRTDGLAATRSITSAVAPGGRLLVIGHVHDEHSRAHAMEHGFDPHDYVSIDDVVDVLGTDFVVEIDDERTRQNQSDDEHARVDRVLVARRATT